MSLILEMNSKQMQHQEINDNWYQQLEYRRRDKLIQVGHLHPTHLVSVMKLYISYEPIHDCQATRISHLGTVPHYQCQISVPLKSKITNFLLPRKVQHLHYIYYFYLTGTNWYLLLWMVQKTWMETMVAGRSILLMLAIHNCGKLGHKLSHCTKKEGPPKQVWQKTEICWQMQSMW